MSTLAYFCIDHHRYPRLFTPGRPLGVGPKAGAMLNDRAEPSIAHLNGQINECTGIWWVWKHLDELGNPDYVGFCHYRRFFASRLPRNMPARGLIKKLNWMWKIDSTEDLLHQIETTGAEGLLPQRYDFGDQRSTRDHFIRSLNEASGLILDEAVRRLGLAAPDKAPYFEAFLKDNIFYACEMFVVPQARFRELCETLFPVIFSLLEDLPTLTQRNLNPRIVGYCCEWLLSAWWYALIQQGHTFHEVPVLFVKMFADRNPFLKGMVALLWHVFHLRP